MNIYPLDIGILIWLLAGTLVLKKMLHYLGSSMLRRILFFLVALLLAAMPIVALKGEIAEFSSIAVVLAGIVIFWFAILASRGANVT